MDEGHINSLIEEAVYFHSLAIAFLEESKKKHRDEIHRYLAEGSMFGGGTRTVEGSYGYGQGQLGRITKTYYRCEKCTADADYTIKSGRFNADSEYHLCKKHMSTYLHLALRKTEKYEIRGYMIDAMDRITRAIKLNPNVKNLDSVKSILETFGLIKETLDIKDPFAPPKSRIVQVIKLAYWSLIAYATLNALFTKGGGEAFATFMGGAILYQMIKPLFK